MPDGCGGGKAGDWADPAHRGENVRGIGGGRRVPGRYSGLLEGRNDWDYFVPPVYDAQQPDGYFKTREREIMASVDHKEMSQELQLWLFRQYRMLNARGEEKDLVEIWQDYHTSPRIREKYPLLLVVRVTVVPRSCCNMPISMT